MSFVLRALIVALLVSGLLAQATFAGGPAVARFQSVLGDFEVLLDPQSAPISVANFTGYANRGDYQATFIHRSTTYNAASIQIVQGGGFFLEGNTIFGIPTQPPILLETNQSNLRGTIAMARTSAPDSATCQWFFNLADNRALDPGTPTGGYAVFGSVLGRGMDVIDQIGEAPVVDLSGQLGPIFSELPLIGNSLVLINSVRVEPFAITNFTRSGNTAELRWQALSTNTPVRVERAANLTGALGPRLAPISSRGHSPILTPPPARPSTGWSPNPDAEKQKSRPPKEPALCEYLVN